MQGNLSMSWRANLLLAGCIAFVCLGIAFAMAWFGLWMVIPFAGLEVVFVACCLYWTVKKLSRKEVITVDDQLITLEWGYNHPEETVSLPRQWSALKYRRSNNLFDVGVLGLQAHGKRYALGTSLGREEKHQLYVALKAIL